MGGTTTRARRPVKPGSGKKTANRFAKLAGGDAAADIDFSPTADGGQAADSGLIGGMSAVAAEDSHRLVRIPVAETAPHPFNDHERSQPQPGDPKWDELLSGIKANGVRLPLLLVRREAFVAARPALAESIAPESRYVVIYGHRRRAAALEVGCDTVPAIIDDATMDNDGDLDAMATENLGRQDLSALAEAELFARFSDIGLSQRAIGLRLGVDQGTVSRRLSLLLLAPEVRAAIGIGDGKLPSAEAAVVGAKLPFGPLRRWQKSKDAGQDTEARRGEQIEAQRLIVQHNWSSSRAAERVIAEREARAEAATLGIDLVDDPRAELGESYVDHRISRDEYSAGADVLGAINANTGQLDLYRRDLPRAGEVGADAAALGAGSTDPTAHEQKPAPPSRDPEFEGNALGECDSAGGGESDNLGEESIEIDAEAEAIAAQQRVDAAAAVAVQGRRREACAGLITHQPTNAELLRILVRQCLSGVAARYQTSAVNALLRDWDASAAGQGEKARHARAWHRAIAAAELHTAELKDKAWDDDAVAHVELLVERVGYQPAVWERDQLDTAAR